ncbi:MAG TPA: PAS domain S-box protein [Dissulfurispiraceae bacterium]|nr:PAS domain S-box protein [Dissulfurispiraceae bacterium]
MNDQNLSYDRNDHSLHDSHLGTDAELRRLKVLHTITTSILSITNFQELLNNIAIESVKFFNASGSILRLLEDGKLKVEACSGLCDEIKIELEIGEGICGLAAQEGKTVYFNRADGMHNAAMESIEVAICTPLKIGDTLTGTFSLYDKMTVDGDIVPFSEDDRITLEGFASVAAIVIEKSMLYDKALKKEREAVETKKQVEELKDYLEGLIENSPDAIVTTDLNGTVTSWNDASEKMFGYARDEVMGRFLPIVPHFLVDTEKSYMIQIGNGETLKDLETVRKTKDGRIIDVNMNMSPIKNSSGHIIGISRVGRDITERKRIEKDLLRKNNELSRLLFISSTMRGTLELDRLLRMVLTAVTMGDGLGFNRAMLFLIEEDGRTMKGAMGVGPANHDEAWEIWSRLSMENKDIHAIMQEIELGPLRKDSMMDRLCCGITVSLDDDTVLTRAVKEKKSFNILDVHTEPLSDAVLIQQLGTMAYAVLPLISRSKVIGVLWVDNLYSRKPITDHDMNILKGFTDQIASAIENLRLFEHVTEAEQELENIFESISDLLYINGRDYSIKKINRAVVDKIGKPPHEIIGKKCYEIFHGMDSPWDLCPHRKTISSNRSYVGEVDDPNLGGTFLISSSPLFDQSGELTGTVHIARDVSEIKKLKEKMVSIERMAALGEMAAKVAHEIRNPLLSIGGFARRLEKRLDSNLKEHAKIIVDEVRRLEGILNNTLSFVKSSITERSEVAAADLIADISTLLEPAVNERGNVLKQNIDHSVLLMINYDRMKEAILNLVSNANNATENGTITVSVYSESSFTEPDLLGHRAEEREAIIEIRDTGHGIREEDLNRIWDPFFTTRPTGTGLGLSITKRIVEEHAGKIDVESNAGEGTIFRIYLPLKGGQA